MRKGLLPSFASMSQVIKPVWVALGANLGDRAGYLRQALQLLKTVASGPLAVSKVYETPPVGPGDQGHYLNCVVRLETQLSPLELLAFCKASESRLGRKPRGRWAPREIDLDILAYGQEWFQRDGLILPHPSILDRQFVLIPLVDLDPHLILPGFRETVSEQLRRCIERQGPMQIREYGSPTAIGPRLPERLRYIAIEGCIGAGKTTLVKLLAERLGTTPLFEEFENNPFLADFYRDRQRFAFQTQVFFLLSRFRQIQDQFSQQDLFRPQILSDYMFAKDRIFASLTLDENELSLYHRMEGLLARQIPQPDYVVYLQADTRVLLQRIRQRDRHYERDFDEGYLNSLNQAYNTFFHHYDASPLLIVNTNQIDYVRRPDELDFLLSEIIKAPEGVTFFNSAR